jgi:hypothetical protein
VPPLPFFGAIERATVITSGLNPSTHEALATTVAPSIRYGGDIMMSRTQILLEQEIQRRARQRASDLGVSLAEYVGGPR